MGVIVDTSVLVAGERGTVRIEAFFDSVGGESVCMSAITASELLHGYHRATSAGIRARRAAFVESLLELIPILPFGLPEARRHSELWAELVRRGTMIGAHDLIIAATALAHGHSLATLNRREFSQVRGLQLADVERFVE